MGDVLQLQGDQREAVADFLEKHGTCAARTETRAPSRHDPALFTPPRAPCLALQRLFQRTRSRSTALDESSDRRATGGGGSACTGARVCTARRGVLHGRGTSWGRGARHVQAWPPPLKGGPSGGHRRPRVRWFSSEMGAVHCSGGSDTLSRASEGREVAPSSCYGEITRSTDFNHVPVALLLVSGGRPRCL